MLSYQHIFHAGNRADVMKHACLHLMLRLQRRGQAPIRYVETHAGRGLYDLRSAEAQKTGEFHDGIAAALAAKGAGADFAAYTAFVRRFNPTRAVRFYPGSPAIAAGVLAPHDRINLAELHPKEHAALVETFRSDPRVRIAKADGFALAAKMRPSPGVRTLVLIDPSYEVKSDYVTVCDLASEITQNDPHAVVLIWFPLMSDAREQVLIDRLAHAGGRARLLTVVWPPPREARRGLAGSGMAVLGAPPQHLRRLEALCAAVTRIYSSPPAETDAT